MKEDTPTEQPNISNTAPPVYKSKSNSPLLWILAFILVGLGGFIIGKSFTTTSPSAPFILPSPVQTAASPVSFVDWKTYINNKYDYQFKYPSDWTMDPYQGSTHKLSEEELSQADGVSIGKLILDGQKGISIGVSALLTQTGNLTSCHESIIETSCLQQFIENRKLSGYNPPLPQYEKISINQIPAIQFKEPVLNQFTTTTILVKNNILITFVDSAYDYDKEIANQILSTFTFLGDTQVDTSNWKTYVNSQYKYSIKYPLNFTTQNQAAGTGNIEALSNSRSLYIFDPELHPDNAYNHRYLSLEILETEPNYSDNWYTITQVTIDGKNTTKYATSGEVSNFDIYVVKLDNNLGFLEIYVNTTQDQKEISNQIFSTFQFTSP